MIVSNLGPEAVSSSQDLQIRRGRTELAGTAVVVRPGEKLGQDGQ